MKRAIAVVVASILLGGIAPAQDIMPAIKSGAKSINFTFGGLGTFGLTGAGVAGGISGSYFFSKESAVRVGLQVASRSTTTPWNDYTANKTNPGSDGTSSIFAFGISGDYLWYISGITPRVKPFLGVGVSVISQTSDTKPPIATSAPNGTLTETKNGTTGDGLTFGSSAIIGAEFFLWSELSLSAEYQLNLYSMTSSSDLVQSYKGVPSVTTKQGSTTTILGFGAAGATLHIYF